MRTIVVLLPLILALAAVLVVAAIRPRSELAVPSGSRLAQVRRRTGRWRWGGVALGSVLAVASVQTEGTLGRGVMLAAPLFALGVLVGVIVGELRVAAPSRTARAAPLEVRRVRDYLPRRLTSAVAAAACTLGLVLAATTAFGSPDDLGRAGRSLVRACSDILTTASSPWPGSFYSLPLAAVVLGGLGATAFALQQVVRRPRQGEHVPVDDLLRRNAAAAVIAATGILVAVPLAGTSAISAIALFGSTCPRWWTTTIGWTLVMIVPLASALTVWCVAVLVMPARIVARHEVG
jgi:hypothetical protein